MSAPAALTVESNNVPDRSDLIIVEDGSPLWLAPDPKDEMRLKFGWRIDGISAFLEQLPPTNFPVLIGAPHRTAHQLCIAHTENTIDSSYPWCQWGETVELAKSLRVSHRFPGASIAEQFDFGTTDSDATQVELWFITNEAFKNGTQWLDSNGWASSLRRLGFDVRQWRSSMSLLENLKAKHARNLILPTGADGSPPQRPSSIAVVELQDGQLISQRHKIG